ncbi:MAG: hypothetical protein KDI46_08100 [Alphaproteobacteria bacterium]|nr:hypothetical protein [Alphaproteobacteria bacterium]
MIALKKIKAGNAQSKGLAKGLAKGLDLAFHLARAACIPVLISLRGNGLLIGREV